MTERRPPWSAWRVVVGFGVVSLLADMVYEGARSMYGPLLATLGASAVVVGLVTGLGEAMALVLRLVFGPLADRTGAYWSLTILGYGLTAVCVPLLAVTPLLGAAGVAAAAVLILIERGGKAVRSPSKTALLAHAAGAVGRGRGFGVHKALDQVGSFAGPLLVAAVVAASAAIWPAMAVLAVPGAAAVGLLLWIRSRVPDLSVYDTDDDARPGPAPSAPVSAPVSAGAGQDPAVRRNAVRRLVADVAAADLPRRFFLFAASAGLATAGLVTFGVISYHLTTAGLVDLPAVPLVYAAGMAVAALAALATGYAYDRWAARVLYVLPVLVAAVPPLAFSGATASAVVGVLIWGAAVGLQDSTVKALVADLVPAPRRASAYGVFAAIQGAAAIAGGALAGALYAEHLPVLVGIVVVLQVGTALLLAATLRGTPPGAVVRDPGANPHAPGEHGTSA